jgi:hypothetical protein
MTETFINLSEQNEKSKNYSVYAGLVFIIIGIFRMTSENNSASPKFTNISSLISIVLGFVTIVIGSSKSSPEPKKYIKITKDIIVYKLSFWGKEKEIKWSELSVIQLNNKMIKVDFKDNVRFELFDLSKTTDENIKTAIKTFSIIAKEKGLEII